MTCSRRCCSCSSSIAYRRYKSTSSLRLTDFSRVDQSSLLLAWGACTACAACTMPHIRAPCTDDEECQAMCAQNEGTKALVSLPVSYPAFASGAVVAFHFLGNRPCGRTGVTGVFSSSFLQRSLPVQYCTYTSVLYCTCPVPRSKLSSTNKSCRTAGKEHNACNRQPIACTGSTPCLSDWPSFPFPLPVPRLSLHGFPAIFGACRAFLQPIRTCRLIRVRARHRPGNRDAAI